MFFESISFILKASSACAIGSFLGTRFGYKLSEDRFKKEEHAKRVKSQIISDAHFDLVQAKQEVRANLNGLTCEIREARNAIHQRILECTSLESTNKKKPGRPKKKREEK